VQHAEVKELRAATHASNERCAADAAAAAADRMVVGNRERALRVALDDERTSRQIAESQTQQLHVELAEMTRMFQDAMERVFMLENSGQSEC
jgi:hypothetical protein